LLDGQTLIVGRATTASVTFDDGGNGVTVPFTNAAGFVVTLEP
jgi:hypothetical protein